jgi:hypothetical protein
MPMVVFWVVTPRGLVDGYQRFGGTYYLHLQERTHAYMIFEDLTTEKMSMVVFWIVRSCGLVDEY